MTLPLICQVKLGLLGGPVWAYNPGILHLKSTEPQLLTKWVAGGWWTTTSKYCKWCVCVGVYPQISSESQRILCYQNVKNVFLFIFTAEQVCGLDTMVFSKHLEITTPMFVLQYFFSHIQYSVTEFVLYFSLIFLDPLQIKCNPTSVSYYPHWFALQAILRAQGLSFVILICCWFLISFWVNCICCTLLFLHSI